MIRTLIFMALIAMSLLTASCCLILPCCGYRGDLKPLTQTTRETLTLVKKEVNSSIILTNEKVKSNEVDLYVGKEVIDSMKETIKQIDTLIAASLQLEKTTGTKEELMIFAERSNQVIVSTLTNLKSLRDLYDISTCSQFETVTFFPEDAPGIPFEKIDEANKVIEPVARRIVGFFAEHPRQKFKAVILISCTSDGRKRKEVWDCKGGGHIIERRARSVAILLVDDLKSQEEFIPIGLINWDIQWFEQKDPLPDAGKRPSTVSILWNLVPAAYAKNPK